MRTAAVVAFCIVAAFVVADVSAASTAKPGAAVASASTPGKASVAAGTLSTPVAKPASVAADPKATPGDACPTECPYSYVPLCGKSITGNTRTFSNQCDLKKYNCTYPNKYELFKQGKC